MKFKRIHTIAPCEREKKFEVFLSPKSIVVLIILACVASFASGRWMRSFLDSSPHRSATTPIERNLATPSVVEGKEAPLTSYTSKDFGSAVSVSSNMFHPLLNRVEEADVTVSGETLIEDNVTLLKTLTPQTPSDNEIHLPSGQHILVDIEHVESAFLNSEERLAEAMVKLVDESGLTMLSYHCHKLIPMGVSCIGVLLESHVSFHTWPEAGVITLDLFTCGEGSLLPVVDVVKRLFGIKDSTREEEPHMIWSHKNRGFRDLESEENREEVFFDIFRGYTDIEKTRVLSVETPYQTIDIYDINQSGRFGEKQGDSVSDATNRVLYLDHVSQSFKYGEAAYHEALVHPGMFTHKEPRRVAIIGGGEGASLREVLKHKSVEQVVFLEIDQTMLEVSKEYLNEWNDCSNMEFAVNFTSCYDDPRVEVHVTDAIAWFFSHFSSDRAQNDADPFDVVIMDALDPSSTVAFSDVLYTSDVFVDVLYNSLTEEGILVVQMGQSASAKDRLHPELLGFSELLENASFESIHHYDEMHSRFDAPWSYLVAMKTKDSRSNWYANEAEITLDISRRSYQTKDGTLPYRFFDAAMHMSYQYPSRIFENAWCSEMPSECGNGHGFDPEIQNFPISSFRVQTSGVDEKAGRGVYANVTIPKTSYLAIEECVHNLFIPPKANEIAETSMRFDHEFWETLVHGYLEGYGWEDNVYGGSSHGVDGNILTFCNHGCNGEYNIGEPTEWTEMSVDVGQGAPPGFNENETFNPFFFRHFPIGCTGLISLEDIQTNEELLDNYLPYGGRDDEGWEANLMELKGFCTGTDMGRVTRYESEDEL